MEKVLEIGHLTKKFGKMTAVDNLSFSVEKGNIYGLLGPNGSGKSTTLGIILNVVNPTIGSWKWFGEDPTTNSLKKIGAIIERPNFYPYLSAEKNLEIVAQIKGAAKHKIDEKLKLVGLFDRKHDKFRTFSLGMKQRLAIGAALLNDPEVLILDEPTNGLDPQGIIQIRELILQIASMGTTIILASHLLDEVEKVCSHVVILEKGKTLYSGRVDEMTAGFGYFEISSGDNHRLQEVLLSLPHFDRVSSENGNGLLKAILREDLSGEVLNKQLFEQGIVLKHLVKRKESLEQQFLQITKNQNG
ncbi:ABC transporter ATP-binding protein [Crocinitomicaceae bacterium CZZ-1]|uniref:ABC transporter ATP-binding protein n=1 Tax=Taishania pollutisoli TaxID=2766479 RepID=A0A8J6TSZ3_9FLAO|nr:ABC transporter ATP-binding protein [Taishania pollutisoli]MBC9812039.1 ABC transporter ATP-binding protein [Taishania pollutisoli]MBX2949885.1 ABC transporter ATP-binding protein [Crocinitomicaceae bacterium]NGF74804.1 ABC transporter ATP-binding protein [Fluviicola sp. SGL-29]